MATPDSFAKRQGSGSAAATTAPSRPTPTRAARQSGSQTLPARSAQRRLPLGGPGSGSAGGSGELARQSLSGAGSLRNSLVDKSAAPLDDPTTEELLPCPDPELALRRATLLLTKASKAKRADLNWQEQYESLLELRRLTVHHPKLVVPELHQIALATAPALDSLRSQIAKLAVALARILHEAGFPPGVVNLVLGPGSMGQAIVDDERVHGITFTVEAAVRTSSTAASLPTAMVPPSPVVASACG